MKYLIRKIVCILLLLSICSYIPVFSYNTDNPMKLTNEEKQWIEKNKDRVFILGLDPYSGFEHFKYKGEDKGYLMPFVELMHKDLGLNLKLEVSSSWEQVYSGLQTGSVDILCGANETPERQKFMSFTRPFYKYPYTIVTRKDGDIDTIGDIDKKNIGFIKDDIVINLLPQLYKNVKYKEKYYSSIEHGVEAVKNKEVEAFITAGGPVIYDSIYKYPELESTFKLNTITSDMTLSTRKEDSVLAGILDKEIQYMQNDKLPKIINQSEIDYNIKLMNLTDSELEWLKNDGKAVVGVTKDYLPFDYYINGDYKGISGEIIKEISRKTGVKFTYDYEDFDSLNEKLKKGDIDILNIAKTEDRKKYILYPRPYSTERDIIVGRKESKNVRDVFGLEGKKVAVIKGFWHYEYLNKNLTDVHIIETDNIQESLNLVHDGKADYLIENPSVVRYYTEELQLLELVEKGTTSTDSYLYYGIAKDKPELASIIDKVIPLMDIDELSKVGYEEVPHTTGLQQYRKYITIIVGLAALLIVIVLFVIKLIKDLVKERTESELLRQREHYLYTDTLTNVYNRNYFNRIVIDTLDLKDYPQSVIAADMNNLKIVNDKHGHSVGDMLLKLFADILKEVAPRDSFIIRMGGDEFAIILENTNDYQAEQLINRIKTEIKERNITINEDAQVMASAAFGYSTRYSDEESFDELIKRADKNMYEDKYKNRVCRC